MNFNSFPPCCICGETRGLFYFAIVDYEGRCLKSVLYKGALYKVCHDCLITSSDVYNYHFTRPIRDLPLLIHDKNPVIRDIARHRLDMPECWNGRQTTLKT
jgi:hypothetical protein